MSKENLKEIDLNELKARVFDEVYKKIIEDEKDEHTDFIAGDVLTAYEIFGIIENM